MKIGIVCPYNLFRSGGVQEHVQAQAELLTDRGHEVKTITPRPRGYKGSPPDNVIFIGSSATLKMPISTSLELGGSFERDSIDEMLEHYDFDVLHIHEPEVPMLASQIIAKATCPIVATFHAHHPNNAAGKTITRFRVPYSRSIFSRLNYITAVSEVAAQFVRDHTDKKEQHIEIIPNGIVLDKYTSQASGEAKTILYVGRLEKRKGVKYLLAAFKKLNTSMPETKLLIAGDGPDYSKLTDYVDENKIKNVEFLGFVEEKIKMKLYKEAGLFCSPAIYGESFGIVLLEAMAAGLPIVAADNPGYSSVMKGRGLLSLVDVTNADEFSRRLELLLSDEDLRQSWRDWAKSYVAQFDYKIIVSKYEKLYNKVLGK